MDHLAIAALIIGCLLNGACGGPPPADHPRLPREASTDAAPPAKNPLLAAAAAAAQTPSAAPLKEAEKEVSGDAAFTGQEQAAQESWVKNTSPETDPAEDTAMPPDLLKDNMRTTQYTAVVRITAAIVEDPHPGFGYVNHVYRARVVETLRGESLDTIEYKVMADRGISLFMPSYPIIVSLCGTNEKGFYVPDNGYITAAAASLLKLARRVAKKLKPSTPAPACE